MSKNRCCLSVISKLYFSKSMCIKSDKTENHKYQ